MQRKLIYITGPVLLILFLSSLYLGSIPPSPLYYLKVTRETLQSLFVFGDEDKANWLLLRADKRLSEAEKLKMKNMEFFAGMQIDTAKQYQIEAEEILEVLKNKTNITYLRDRSNQNIEKLKLLEGN